MITLPINSFCVTIPNAGNIVNTSSITGGGISLTNGTVTGQIVSFGSIVGGITIDSSSLINFASGTALQIRGISFSGGISNGGTISAGAGNGISVHDLPAFSGGTSSTFSSGISNSGAISAANTGISVNNVTSFSGGISNSGAISAGLGAGIFINGVTTFSGGIGNSGTISAANTGIFVDNVSSFSGGISNSGTISAVSGSGAGIGIGVYGVTSFSGGTSSTFSSGISNSGAISAANTGIFVNNVSSFSGGISNSGTISAGSGSGAGIGVYGVSSFSGGISNSGAISAGSGSGAGIGVYGVTSFGGGISNSGTISTGGVAGIDVSFVGAFSGGISNSGAISAGSGAGITVSSVSTFSGNISNSGTISAAKGIEIGPGVGFAAGSAIVNSGTIIGSAAAIDVSAATSPVAINQTGGLISGAIKLSTHADVLNVSGGAIAGDIIGGGDSANTLNFALGSGTFTYGSAYGFSGIKQVNVNSGLVILNGVNTATNVRINGGTLEVGDAQNPGAKLTSATPIDIYGTLAGHGTVFGSVLMEPGGVLAPGGSIGVLTITGGLSFAPGSFYAVAITPAAASMTQFNGAVVLGGVTVQVTPQLGKYSARTYQILGSSIALGAGNTFNPTVQVTRSGLIKSDPTLSYDANDVYLTVAPYISTLDLPANSPWNARNAAGAINNFINSGAPVPDGFQNLAGLSGNALSSAVNQLAGQQQGAFAPGGFKAGDLFLNLLLNPYVEGRGNFGAAATAPAMAYAADPVASGVAKAFSALALDPSPVPASAPVFWGAAYGAGGKIAGDGATGAARNNSNIYGFATGADYHVRPNAVVGVALAGGGTSYGLGQGMGGGYSSMFQAGAYGALNFGQAYVSAALAYTFHDVTTNRAGNEAGIGNQNGSFNANLLSNRVEAGYSLPVYGGLTFTPYAANQVQAMWLPSFAETAAGGAGSAFSLGYTSRNFNTDRTELGAWMDYVYPGSGGALKFFARAAWAHDFNNEGTTAAFFQSIVSGNFTVYSAKQAPNGALTTLGVQYYLGDGWALLAKFDGEFSGTSTIYSATGQLRKTW